VAGEIALPYETGRTVYVVIRDRNSRPYSSSGAGGFNTYNTSEYADYAVSLTEQGTASAYYVGNFPSISSGGIYSLVAHRQAGGSPAETDPNIGGGDVHWDGSKVISMSELANSGQIGQLAPLRMAKANMVLNFPFKLVSSTDNKTAFTSGVVSGQISKDGGNFGVLQSGAFTELGHGWYSLQALTSGDLDCNAAALLFTANGVSGGQAAQRDFGILLQKSARSG